MRALFGVVFLLSAACVFSCGGSAVAKAPLSHTTPWVETMLGGPASLSVVSRPAAHAADPYWGPLLARTTRKDVDEIAAEQLAALWGASQIELFLGIRDWARAADPARKDEEIDARLVSYVFVIRDLPPFDPLALQTRGGERLFGAAVRLPSGAVEYAPEARFAERRRGLAPWLYALSDRTWVGVDSVTAARAHATYSKSAGSPPAMDIGADGLTAIFIGAAAVQTASERAEWKDDAWRRGLGGAGLLIHGGGSGGLELLLDYETTGDAKRTHGWAEGLLKETCTDKPLLCLAIAAFVTDVKMKRDDRRVSARFVLSEMLLKKIAEP
jgi:hypothetical protein